MTTQGQAASGHISTLMAHVTGMESKVASLKDSQESMQDKLTTFRAEIAEECKLIDEHINRVRGKIECQIVGYENLDGFLTGEVTDYLDTFEAQVHKMNSQFDKANHHWESRAQKLKRD